MRATGRPCVLLCALLASLPVAVAQAKITPVPKPAHVTAKPGASHAGSLIAPISRPTAHRTVRPARRRIVRPHRATIRRPARAPRRHAFAPASISGGRELNWLVSSAGGRDTSPVEPPAVVPTPLALVGAGEALPAYRTPWPAWKVAALTLLAVAEAFVVIRLVRDRRLGPMREA